MVLPKCEIVPDIVTAGLDTVAVRLSAHPVFAEIVGELDEPLAAPSANRFGRVSPTTAQHVLDELGGRIPLIVDAGPTEHGIESTIVAVRDGSNRDLATRSDYSTNSYRSLQKSSVWWVHQRFPRRDNCRRIMRRKPHCVWSIMPKNFLRRRISALACLLGAALHRSPPKRSLPFEF